MQQVNASEAIIRTTVFVRPAFPLKRFHRATVTHATFSVRFDIHISTLCFVYSVIIWLNSVNWRSKTEHVHQPKRWAGKPNTKNVFKTCEHRPIVMNKCTQSPFCTKCLLRSLGVSLAKMHTPFIGVLLTRWRDMHCISDERLIFPTKWWITFSWQWFAVCSIAMQIIRKMMWASWRMSLLNKKIVATKGRQTDSIRNYVSGTQPFTALQWYGHLFTRFRLSRSTFIPTFCFHFLFYIWLFSRIYLRPRRTEVSSIACMRARLVVVSR